MTRDEMTFAPLSDQDLAKIQETEKLVNQQQEGKQRYFAGIC